MLNLSQQDVHDLARELVDEIMVMFHNKAVTPTVYPVPRGGVPVAYLIAQFMSVEIVDSPDAADFIVDDIVESGTTRARFGDKPFYALIDKPVLAEDHPHKDWIVFPWERQLTGGDASVTDNVTRLLQFIGEDPKRGGLEETPMRVVKAWREWTSGYTMDPAAILKTFEDGATDEMVIERNIPFFSHCEHHMAPFFGTVDICYIPNGKIVGLSKMNRLVECFARRLQVQERLTGQIADAMMEHLDPLGVAVLVKAEHMCVKSRGVRHAGCDTVTSALRGVLKDGMQRAEFMALTR